MAGAFLWWVSKSNLIRYERDFVFALLSYPFIQNAFLSGSLVAIVAALMGYFLVIRGLTFAGHALSNIGFAGAAGAVLLGVHPVDGLLVFTVAASLAISLMGNSPTGYCDWGDHDLCAWPGGPFPGPVSWLC